MIDDFMDKEIEAARRKAQEALDKHEEMLRASQFFVDRYASSSPPKDNPDKKFVVGTHITIPKEEFQCYHVLWIPRLDGNFALGKMKGPVDEMNVQIIEKIQSRGNTHPEGTYIVFEDEDGNYLAVLITDRIRAANHDGGNNG